MCENIFFDFYILPAMQKLFFFLLFLATLSFATDVQVLPAAGADFSKDAPVTVNALPRDAVQKTGNTPVDTASPVQLRASLMALGKTYVVVCEKLEYGKVTGSAKLKAASVEELDVVIERSATAALTGENAETNTEVGKVTENEKTDIVERTETKRYGTFGFGPALWHNWDGDAALAYLIRFGAIWEASPQGAVTLTNNVALAFDKFQVHEDLLVGGRYYFSPASLSAFAGGGLGLGTGFDSNLHGASDRFAFGLAGGVNFGAVFFRTASTQLEVGAGYDFFFDGFQFDKIFGKANVYVALNY